MTNTEDHSHSCITASRLLGLNPDEVCAGECMDSNYMDGYRDSQDGKPLRSRPTGMYAMNYAIGYFEGLGR